MEQQRRTAWFIRLIALAAIVSSPATGCQTPPSSAPSRSDAPSFVPFSMTETFDNGELNGWASYPPAQDTAYDTTLFVRKGEDGRRSLTRTLHAYNSTRQFEVGVIRPIRCRIGSLRLFMTIVADEAPADVRVTLCSQEGELFTGSSSATSVGKRSVMEFSSADFSNGKRSLTSQDEIAAIVAEAVWANVQRGKDYRIAIDRLELRGERRQRLMILSPSSVYLEKWDETILTHHPLPGKPLKIDVQAESARVTTLSCVIDGKDVVAFSETGVCEDKAERVFQRGEIFIDEPGLHRLTFRGKLQFGGGIEASARVLVASPTTGHPRLYAASERLRELQRRAKNDKDLALLIDKAVAYARAALGKYKLDDIVAVDNLPVDILIETKESKEKFWTWYKTLLAARSLIGQASFLYAATDDASAGEIGKSALLKMCAIRERWLHPWFTANGMQTYYMMGEVMAEIGLGYDLLYPLLSEEERAVVRRSVIDYGLRPAYHELVEQNRIPFHGSNWIAVNLSGQLMAAAATIGEDRNDPELEPYLTGLLMKMEAHIDAAFLADGSYGEGVGYESFSLEYHGRAFPPMKELWGIDFAAKPRYNRCYRYPIYAMSAKNDILDFGDSGYYLSVNYRDGYRWLARDRRDPMARWLYLRLFKEVLSQGEGDDALRFDLFLWEDGVQPRGRETLPPSTLFAEKGTAVFRTGWGEDDAQFLFQCGPFFNHNHVDAGTFFLRALGEEFVAEAGKTHYYDNPDYQPIYVQPAGHNVLLIDNDAESMRIPDFASSVKALKMAPRIVECRFGKRRDSLCADLAPVYKGALEAYRRQFVMEKPNHLVMLDQVRSKDAPHAYTWQFHIPGTGGIERLAENRYLIARPKGKMTIHIYSPQLIESRVVDGPIPFEKDRVRNSILRIATKAPASTATLVVVFSWSAPDERSAETAVAETTQSIAVKLRTDREKARIAFSRDEEGMLKLEDNPDGRE